MWLAANKIQDYPKSAHTRPWGPAKAIVASPVGQARTAIGCGLGAVCVSTDLIPAPGEAVQWEEGLRGPHA
eukprot:7382178-Alexandrium_andersonii.AAC.1